MNEREQVIEKLARWVVKTAGLLMARGPAQRWEIHIHAKGTKVTGSYTVYDDQDQDQR